MDVSSRQQVIARIAVVIVICTLVLTANFIGIIAAIEGDLSDFADRIPWYLLVAAAVFVATIVLLELNDADGRTIIASALFAGVVSFFLVIFGVEGVIFTVQNPETVFVEQLILYFVAASLVATGVGFWALRHWREFISNPSGSL